MIKKGPKIGSGAQADVFKVNLVGLGDFVDKTRKIIKNETQASETFKQMFKEFHMAKDLDHPNIVKYVYFMRKYHEKT
jgi:3-hydroxy-3-methylglutaryl CoA synthase